MLPILRVKTLYLFPIPISKIFFRKRQNSQAMSKIKIIILAVGILLIAVWLKFRRKTGKIDNVISKLPSNGAWGVRSIDNIEHITIHHSASPANQDAFNFARYHVNSRGWPRIGYHYVIKENGLIQKTNEHNALSWHNGYNNGKAIGICLSGNFEEKQPTKAQTDSLYFLINKLKMEIPGIKYLNGHKEYIPGKTACPGKYFDLDYARSKSRLSDWNNNKSKPVGLLVYNSSEADN